MDLTTFPGEEEGQLVALKTRDDLDSYTYYVAGCVGEFWTEMHMAHHPSLKDWDVAEMKKRGVRFGKGLQMTNILRDLSKDLRLGRCYLPQEDLETLELAPSDLLDPQAIDRVRPLLHSLLEVTLAHYREGWNYTLAIPRQEVRMRLAWEGQLVALKTRDDLDSYTYYVAGCVGEFWTEMHMAHHPSLKDWDVAEMKKRGVRFGKGLQMTNILRDLSKDIGLLRSIGRWIPQTGNGSETSS